MAKILDMPKLSPTMEEGQISLWHKKEGDEIAVDDLLAEVETDKATMEYRSFDKGTLLKILAPAGSVVRLGEPVAILGAPGEDISALPGGSSGSKEAPSKGADASPAAESAPSKGADASTAAKPAPDKAPAPDSEAKSAPDKAAARDSEAKSAPDKAAARDSEAESAPNKAPAPDSGAKEAPGKPSAAESGAE